MIGKLRQWLKDARELVSDLSGLTMDLAVWVLLLIAVYEIVYRHWVAIQPFR